MKIRESRTSPSTGVDVRRLLPADIEKLHLANHPHVDEADVVALVVQHPGVSCWIPSTGEFALVTPWRHRSDLVTIHTLSAFENERILLNAVRSYAEDDGIAGVIMVDMNETRSQSFYATNGFCRVEEIVTYHHSNPRSLAHAARLSRLRFIQVNIGDLEWLRGVQQLDNASFPWLWWNSPQEFAAYVRFPSVEIWAGFLGDLLIAYAGATNYHAWSHLDRIATHPDHQGQGFGRESLLFAVQQMVKQGARSVSLSTQATNTRSRTLYEDLGFARTPRDDYAMYAAVLHERKFRGASS